MRRRTSRSRVARSDRGTQSERGQSRRHCLGRSLMFPIQRVDRIGIRMRDLHSACDGGSRGFAGIVRPAYRVTAKFVPYPSPRVVRVPNVLGQEPEMKSPGYVTFMLDGQSLRLEPVYESQEENELFFIFSDLTSRDETTGPVVSCLGPCRRTVWSSSISTRQSTRRARSRSLRRVRCRSRRTVCPSGSRPASSPTTAPRADRASTQLRPQLQPSFNPASDPASTQLRPSFG